MISHETQSPTNFVHSSKNSSTEVILVSMVLYSLSQKYVCQLSVWNWQLLVTRKEMNQTFTFLYNSNFLIPSFLPWLSSYKKLLVMIDTWLFFSKCLIYHLKVAFSQKGLMRSSFLQTDKPNYFPELEFWFFFLNSSNHVK